MLIYILDDSLLDSNVLKDIIENGDIEKKFTINIENNPTIGKKFILNNYNNIDLLFLDIQMPKINGIDILRNMIENNISIPTIIYSDFINQYKSDINQFNILKSLKKENILSDNENNQKIIAEIFVQLNFYKSCMLLNKTLSDFIKKRKKYNGDLYNILNDLKKNIANGYKV
jgi:chemotaxis response regulator CheB